MDKDRLIGGIILVASVVGIIVYGWLIYAFPTVVLQITAFIAVAAVLVILAWIGWTMATTPPPAPIEAPSVSASTGPEEKTSEGKT